MGGIYAIDNEKSHKTEKPSSHWRDHREEVSGLAVLIVAVCFSYLIEEGLQEVEEGMLLLGG